MLSPPVAAAIWGFTPRTVSSAAGHFAKELTAAARPESINRAKAFLFAAAKLGAYCESVGLELAPEVALHPSVTERCCHPLVTTMSRPTARTVRTNLRAIARAVTDGPAPLRLSRERSKYPYSGAEIACYLALADAQPTVARRHRAGALVSLGAGAGLMGADLRGVAGSDIVERGGGVVVVISSGRRPRMVPVLARYHERLSAAARFAGERYVIGGRNADRRTVTTPLVAALAGGRDLCPLDTGRLRATWLCEVAGAIGLKAFMDAAGITCSQRLGDLVASLPGVDDETAVAALGGRL